MLEYLDWIHLEKLIPYHTLPYAIRTIEYLSQVARTNQEASLGFFHHDDATLYRVTETGLGYSIPNVRKGGSIRDVIAYITLDGQLFIDDQHCPLSSPVHDLIICGSEIIVLCNDGWLRIFGTDGEERQSCRSPTLVAIQRPTGDIGYNDAYIKGITRHGTARHHYYSWRLSAVEYPLKNL